MLRINIYIHVPFQLPIKVSFDNSFSCAIFQLASDYHSIKTFRPKPRCLNQEDASVIK